MKYCKLRQALRRLVCCSWLISSACVSTTRSTPYGVQDGYSSFVPARIATLACRSWPAGARYESLPLTNVSDQQVTAICAAFDTYVLGGFSDQPYMKGFSPKFVSQLLAESKAPNLLAQWNELWNHRGSDCNDCQTIPAFYQSSIANRPERLTWLNEFSKNVRHADAALLPFVTFAYERSYDDRGLEIAERGAGIALLLVDTNNGHLIWAGGREVSAPNKELLKVPSAKGPTLPDWQIVYGRLFAEPLWRGFPGRQEH